MARPPSEILTGREAQVMEAVWRLGDATAEQVREALPEPLHDSSVRTLLRILESKGYLRHEARGKAYVYSARVGRAKKVARKVARGRKDMQRGRKDMQRRPSPLFSVAILRMPPGTPNAVIFEDMVADRP
jgi:hypothetical protein